MTIAALIEKLKTFPPDMMVVAEGYEDGFDSIKSVQEIALVETLKKEWYIGQFQTPEREAEASFTAVLLYAGTKEEKI